jgi:hypothetical protein
VVARMMLALLKEASPRNKRYTGAFLAGHLAQDYPEFRFTDVHIRAMVNYLRRLNEPILSFPNGYRWSENLEEIEECIEDLISREDGIREARKGLERARKRIIERDQPTLFGGTDGTQSQHEERTGFDDVRQ